MARKKTEDFDFDRAPEAVLKDLMGKTLQINGIRFTIDEAIPYKASENVKKYPLLKDVPVGQAYGYAFMKHALTCIVTAWDEGLQMRSCITLQNIELIPGRNFVEGKGRSSEALGVEKKSTHAVKIVG